MCSSSYKRLELGPNAVADKDMDQKIVFRLNDNGIGPELLQNVLLERGWTEYDPEVHGEDGWNIWWKTSRFRTSEYTNLLPWQWINHYPHCTSITKKDCLCRNLRKMRIVHGCSVYNFSPVAYNLPNDYTKFVSEYASLRQPKDKQSGRKMWICKPAESSRGRGIFIFKELSELQYDCNAVVQEYIKDPLLIGGYKFDLRVYVAVCSFHPLQIYVHEEGLVRFGTEKYDLDRPDNVFAHLTNTSINKFSPGYTADKDQVGHGCKWTISQLRRYFSQNNVCDTLLWQRIANIITLTMLMQAPTAPRVSNCFELYGFDVLIDNSMKPWLLEVNFSPSLSSDCHADVISKKAMLHDLLDLISCPESGLGHVPEIYSTSRRGRRGATYSEPGMSSRSRSSQISSGSTVISAHSEKSLIHRRGKKPSFAPNRALPVRHAPINRYRSSKPLENLASKKNPQDLTNSMESLNNFFHRDSPLFRDRMHTYGGRQEMPTPGQRDDNGGSLTVRTDAGLLQVESKASLLSDSGLSSLSSVVDGNNNVSGPNDSGTRPVAPSKSDSSHQHQHSQNSLSNGSRCDTPMPLTQDGSRQSQIFTDSSFSLGGDTPRQLRLQTGNSPICRGENSLGKLYSSKLMSLRPVTPLLKRPVHSSPDCKRLPVEEYQGMNYSTQQVDSQEKQLQADKLSSTYAFRSSLQRNREMRELLPPSVKNPGKNGKPPLTRIARKKVGNFYLVFPFNEHTQQIAHGKLDPKQIIKELQKQQRATENAQRESESSSTNEPWGVRIWAPLRTSEGE
ncbi:tubulin polyglutamylase TTLL13P isoform X2 [Aplysia californica]|uniref:Tubulin polyglutamylase TTLL13P isoform X2 n=1 Tax=Aplysia californica TaxID=6500 RepID=A0ABM0JXS5_APLCA|nr:tubulin polyglutamylase TTLL13P isoform X2 [Aplysia californica]